MTRRALLVGSAQSMRVANVLVPTCVLLVVGGIFAAGALERFPLRYLLAWLLALSATAILIEKPSGSLRRVLSVLVLSWTLTASIFCALFSPLEPSLNDALFRYILLYPLGGLVGALLVNGRWRSWLGRAMVGWGLLSSILAIAEFLAGAHFFTGADVAQRLVRDGFTRAEALAEHPIVLSALIVAALPFLWAMEMPPKWTLTFSAVLCGGIAATMSRGGLLLVLVFLVFFLLLRRWPPTTPGRPAMRVLISIGVTSVVGLALVFFGFLNASFLVSDDPETASLQYRLVLYQKVFESIVTHPWGWGLGGLPQDVYLVSSPFGVHDLSTTVDSEVALLAFDAGILGIALYVALLGYLASRWALASDVGQAAALIVASGSYLALHAWTGLGLITCMVVGAAVADDWKRRRDNEFIGRHPRIATPMRR